MTSPDTMARLRRRAVRMAQAAQHFGIDVAHTARSARAMPGFLADLRTFERLARAAHGPQPRLRLRPVLGERHANAGAALGHYFWQDLWAAKRIAQAAPARHIDIGSRIDGFIAHLLTFREVIQIDIRPLPYEVPGLHFICDDATHLEQIPSGSVASLSSLHAVEHFGLGRYGDTIDPGAWRSALQAMQRVLAAGGRLYLSVPIGRERIEFNAHRVFYPRTIVQALPALDLVQFDAVDDAGHFVADAGLDAMAQSTYACGLFEFTAPTAR